MTEKEVFEEIIKRPKWYAGIRSPNGTFMTPNAGYKFKKAFDKNKHSIRLMNIIFKNHGYEKTENWTKL